MYEGSETLAVDVLIIEANRKPSNLIGLYFFRERLT